MSKRNLKNVAVDDEGIEIGTEMNGNETVTKTFKLSRKTDWPTDADGNPEEIVMTVVIDMKGVKYGDILDDAIRTKIITLQNALRGTGKNQTPFEVLEKMAEEKLHRHYNTMGAAPENPEKQFQNTMADISSMTPEMKKRLMEALAAG